jgi:hypothetical protein
VTEDLKATCEESDRAVTVFANQHPSQDFTGAIVALRLAVVAIRLLARIVDAVESRNTRRNSDKA